MKKNILEQSVWFEDMTVDKNYYPECELEYTDNISNEAHLFDEYSLFDYTNGYNRYIRLSELLQADTAEKLAKIDESADCCDTLTIIDDLCITNSELDFMDDFYLRTFIQRLSHHCRHCNVYRRTA